MSDKYPWLIYDYSKRPNVLSCERCGLKVSIDSPSLASKLINALDNFEEEHKNCKEK